MGETTNYVNDDMNSIKYDLNTIQSTDITNDNKEEEPKEDNLGKDGPFKTIFYLSLGPFFAEVVGAAYGIIDSYWISTTCGEDGLAAFSACSLIDTISKAFAMFVSTAASSKLSKLRGEKDYGSLSQLMADLFRICFIVGLISPAILIPCAKPIMKFFDADKNITKLAVSYIIPVVSGSFISCLNMLFCGVLQSEGRSLLYGAIQISIFVLNGCFFDPIFMKVCKLGMFGAGLSNVCSEFCLALLTGIMFFCGKFETKINKKCLVSKFSKHTWEASKVGFTQFISHISFNIPSLFSRKYVSKDTNKENYSLIFAAYNVVLRTWAIPGSYALALSVGFLPAASFAIGACRYNRYIKLVIWSFVLSLIWCGAMEVVLMTLGSQIAYLFGNKTPEFRTMAAKMLRVSYILAVVMGVENIAAGILQSTKRTLSSIILSIFTQFLPIPMFGSLIYFLDKTHDVLKLLFMYTLHDGFSCLVSLLFIIFPLREILKLRKEKNQNKQNMTKPLLNQGA